MTGTTATASSGLTEEEERALRVSRAVYQMVRCSPVLDAPSHWERFAERLRSAAYAHSAPAFLQQVASRFQVSHTYHPDLVKLLHAPEAQVRRTLRLVRTEANALSVLVRDDNDNRRAAAAAAKGRSE